MTTIYGKGLLCQIGELKKKCCQKVELHLRSDCLDHEPEDCDERDSDNAIYTLHEFKGDFRLDGKSVWGNIANNGKLGDLSENFLRRHVQYCRRLGVERLVFIRASSIGSYATTTKRSRLIQL